MHHYSDEICSLSWKATNGQWSDTNVPIPIFVHVDEQCEQGKKWKRIIWLILWSSYQVIE